MVLASLLQSCVWLLVLPAHVFTYLGLWDSFYKKVFPYIMAKMAPAYNHKVCKQKQALFSNLRTFAGPSGQLTLLEIGTGTGTNFQFYPPGCRLTCTDPNPNFSKFLLKSLSENQHLKLERSVVASGEDLHQIPDGSMDVVVSTLVLCSVGSVQKVLAEVLRVLRRVSEGKKGDLCPTRGPPVLVHVWDKWNRLHEGQDEFKSSLHFFSAPGEMGLAAPSPSAGSFG